jgi:FkbM family methyltransferase
LTSAANLLSMNDFNPRQVYFAYLQTEAPKLDRQVFQALESSLDGCNWEEPSRAWEWNNLAVAALVEADRSENGLTRGLYIEMAFNALHSGVELGDYPLCQAHLALLYNSLGDVETATDLAFNCLLETLQPAYTDCEIPQGIIYIPANLTEQRTEYLLHILKQDNGYFQALYLLGEALCRTQAIADSSHGLRLLHLLCQLVPGTFHSNLQLGIYSLGLQELEGLLYLHRAQELVLDSPSALHALYLAYSELENVGACDHWLEIARDYGDQRSDRRPWQWTTAVTETGFTYMPFEGEILMAIEPSLRSLTTRSLLASGDGYERELELWRQEIQPGMTVVDIGAHVGIYALSAAQRVGKTGRVVAIEPSSFHVACLKESIRLNNYDWMEVFAGAASDSLGQMPLYLQSPAEYHQVLGVGVEGMAWEGEIEEVRAFKVDAWVAQTHLQRLDFLKVSVVGHELAVLKGCQQTLESFRPQIFYHNLFNGEPNIEVADFLTGLGYELFQYRPYVRELLPIGSSEELIGVVKVIAKPT